jgi:hypothetical protein
MSDEPLRWESTTPGYIRFITDSRYRKFSPAVQKWYRPLCPKCAAGVAPGAPGDTDAERAAWLADKIVAGGDYAIEAAAMLRRWPSGVVLVDPAKDKAAIEIAERAGFTRGEKP